MKLNINLNDTTSENKIHLIGIMRGLNYCYDALITQMGDNGVAVTEADKAVELALIDLGKIMTKQIKELAAATGLPPFDTLN